MQGIMGGRTRHRLIHRDGIPLATRMIKTCQLDVIVGTALAPLATRLDESAVLEVATSAYRLLVIAGISEPHGMCMMNDD
jgi:hypothetical protein